MQIVQTVIVIILLVMSMVSYYFGNATLANSKSAVHEIAGLIEYLIAAVFFTGAMIVAAVLDGSASIIKLINKS